MEPNYTMSILSNYGAQQLQSVTSKVNGADTVASFNYIETFFNHFEYRHIVDSNNHRQMDSITIKKT